MSHIKLIVLGFVLWSAPAWADVSREETCGYAATGKDGIGHDFDAVTGSDTRHFPPDPQVDFEHIRLELTFDDLMSRSFRAVETMSFRVLSRSIERLELDAVDLEISSVTSGAGEPLSFRHDGRKLTVRFPAACEPDTAHEIHIAYTCHEPKRGVYFALPDEAYADRPLVIHSKGEPEDSRYWFVCHDFPNERCSTEIIATLPAGYRMVANGEQLECRKLPGGRVRYRFLQAEPHVPYLVSFVIGEFAVVTDAWRGIPVEYWVPPHREKDARRTFGKTPEMIELFSMLLDVDYPYAKYAQIVCYELEVGGMEHTTATVLHEDVMLDERGALDWNEENIISHELAHQWLGDMVTCRSWAHIWLNEGFATFLAHVWEEHERGRNEYDYELWREMRQVADQCDVEASAGMVCAEYNHPHDVFWRQESNPYRKGAAVLHMLRCDLGDDLFWQCVREYVKRYAWQSAETDDFRKVIDELSGRSYERFFHQWVYRPGVPHVKIGYEWRDAEGEMLLRLEQTQKMTRESPAFVGDVAVWLVFEDGRIERRTVPMDERFTSLVVRCDEEPVQVCVDPLSGFLARYTFELPRTMLIRQALEGPTLISRLRAVAALGEEDDDRVRAALESVLLDRDLHWGLRSAAAQTLGRMQQDDARDILIAVLADSQTIDDPQVRRDAVEALGRYRDAQVVPTLVRMATTGGTNGVEGTASRALGRHQPSDPIVEALISNCHRKGPNTWVRRNAMESLGELKDPRAMDAAMAMASYGGPYRNRPIAIRTLGQLGGDEDQTERVRRFLEPLIRDRQERAARAAIEALGTLGDADAIGALEIYAEGSGPAHLREAARRAIDQINKAQGESSVIRDLRERIEKLEQAREDMERKLSDEQGRPCAETRPAS